MSVTNWERHVTVWHDSRGECRETVKCPQYGMVWTSDGPRLADDPTRPSMVRHLTGSLRRPRDDEETSE